MARTETHAIVIGGSLAGLLAARAAAERFDRVTVIERDRFPEVPEPRRGVPQGRHVHALLLAGYRALLALFPGLDEELKSAGVPHMDWTQDVLMLGPTGWAPRYPSGLITPSCTRPLLEWLVRRRVSAVPGVCLRQEQEVTGLLTDAAGRVEGVRVRSRQGAGAEEDLAAALVIDASGRTSRAAERLEALGYGSTPETAVNAHLGYSTRWYRPPPGFAADWKGLMVSTRAPDDRRGGVIAPIEGGRWIVTLAGVGHDYPPTDEDGFLAFVRSLRTQLLAAALEGAEPLTPIAGYQRTDNRLLHFERLPRWPNGFIVTGDAVCAFNPVYGQGMSAAAVAAAALRDALRAAPVPLPTGVTRGFQRRLAALNRVPWLMAAGEDFRWPSTSGKRPPPGLMTWLTHGYSDRVIDIIPRSPAAHRAFIKVWHMVEPPAVLLHPRIVGDVIRLRSVQEMPAREAMVSPVRAVSSS
jgi:flavin-dependent dehydrogenase